jgi:hypothetical protein
MALSRESAGIAGLGQGLHPAVRAIVLDALSGGVGHTLPTNIVYRDTFGLGAGTLQRALDVLRDRGALTVTSRGHLGRVVESIDVGQCWQAAGLAAVRLLLPPSGPIEIEVLDSRLAEELTRLGIPHTVKHLPGGARRLEAIRAGDHDLAIVSAGTFDSIKGTIDGSEASGLLARRLKAGTYYAPGRLVVVRRATANEQSPLRVAIDRNSPDHVALTLGEFGHRDDVALVDAPFPSVPAWVLRNRVDIGIWHEARSVIPLDLAGLSTRPLTSDARDVVSGAVLAVSPQRPELRSVLADFNLDDLLEEQRRALAEDDDQS